MKTKLKIAFLMDPLEKLDLKGDTTFALGFEAQKRGHIIYHFTPDELILRSNNVLANICEFELFLNKEVNSYKYHQKKLELLSDFDVIMMRQDPPFDMSYITATHILEKLSNNTLVVNNPFEVRNAPEKFL
jgi:glutathione synthase